MLAEVMLAAAVKGRFDAQSGARGFGPSARAMIGPLAASGLWPG